MIIPIVYGDQKHYIIEYTTRNKVLILFFKASYQCYSVCYFILLNFVLLNSNLIYFNQVLFMKINLINSFKMILNWYKKFQFEIHQIIGFHTMYGKF